MTALLSRTLQRRTLFKALLAVSILPLGRAGGSATAAPQPLEDDAIVEVGGWILRRSDLPGGQA